MNARDRLYDTIGLMAAAGEIPHPMAEYQPFEGRRYAFDLAWPSHKIAVEYEGLPGSGKSRHFTIAGYTSDCVKYSWAAIYGWVVLRCTAPLVADGSIYEMVREAFRQRGQT